MPRVIGIDPGTVSIDLCGLEDGSVFLERSLPTADALAHPSSVVALLEEAHREAPLDLVVGPSGYGLPLTYARDLTERDIRLAQLTAGGEQSGGIGGLGALMRQLARSTVPVVFTPGVIHLDSVPPHRKVNRVDMGTADKVSVAALAIHDQCGRHSCAPREASFILLELGGAFTAALAVDRGRIVDGAGGTSGSIGMRGAGALDGEAAFLAGTIAKRLLFSGGAATIAGVPDADVAGIASSEDPRSRLAWAAYIEGAVKTVAALAVAAPLASEIIVSGRLAAVADVRDALARLFESLDRNLQLHALKGIATATKHAAQGATIIADGLAGGPSAELVDAMGIRDASGTALDHLYVIAATVARARLGIPD
jgi:predicted butyrate kinase (DUF1464 family)